MVRNPNLSSCGFLCFLICCTYCRCNNAVASAFVPHNGMVRSQQRSSFETLTTAMGEMNTHEGDHNEAAGSIPSPNAGAEVRKSRLVWLTGSEDLRVHDHGGFKDAFSKVIANSAKTNGESYFELIIPVFVIDPKIHLRSRSTSVLKRLLESLKSLEKNILSLSSSSMIAPLVIRTGPIPRVLPALANETNAVACHVVEDDVVASMRSAQKSVCESLTEMGVDVHRWTNRLRPTAPWSSYRPKSTKQTILPSFFPEYCEIADELPIIPPDDVTTIDYFLLNTSKNEEDDMMISSEGVPSFQKLVDMAKSATPDSVHEARSSRRQFCDTTEPFDAIISENWSTEEGARKALKEFCRIGNGEFTNKHFIASDAANKGHPNSKSMYASSVARVIKSSSSPEKSLALREGPTRAFSSALNYGAISARDVADAARNRSPVTPPMLWGDKNTKRSDSNSRSIDNRAGLFPSDDPFWGRSSEGSLSDFVEWREWFRLLAERSLSLQERGEPATSGGEKGMSGDPRESGIVNYWRWKDQHLVRYLMFPAGKDYDAQEEDKRDPAILLVHGFAASGEQWERLVYSMRQQNIQNNNGKDTTPPIHAIDLLGFGHSEKPGVTYTQYLWESQLIDFAMEVMEAVPMVMVGNSIGGGLSAGAAASLGKKICRGLVLLNTAGVLLDPDTYNGYIASETSDGSIDSFTKAALEGNPEEIYSPVPLFGNKALDVFGSAIIGLIYPQIEKRLTAIYGNRMENADPAVVYAIQQSASSPGSSNVIGSGQKLAPNRPLNEVLMGVGEDGQKGFPTLVVMGLDDRVSSPQVAKTRAGLFSKLNPGTVTLKEIEDAGHCPHDESPEKVAAYMLEWLNSSLSGTVATTSERKEDVISIVE